MVEFLAHFRKADRGEQSLAEHLGGVGDRSRDSAAKLGIGSMGELSGLLHDLGKYSDQFQRYLRSAVELINQDEDDYVDAKGLKGKVDHSTAGAQFLYQRLRDGKGLRPLIGELLALCIASHHSGLIDCISPEGVPVLQRRVAKSQDLTHVAEVTAKMDPSILTRVEGLLNSPLLDREFESALKRIGGRYHTDLLRQFQMGLVVRFLFSCLIDADRLDTAIFEQPNRPAAMTLGKAPDWTGCIRLLETHLDRIQTTTQIGKIRAGVSLQCKNHASRERGVYQLTVPTGGGKTLASLRFALHHAQQLGLERIFYVIPYTSIIDQNAAVVRSILEPPGAPKVVLEHHSNLTPEQDTWRSKLLAENWDAPVVFTTSVQFLETLFSGGTRGVRRMHQLANSLVIFDEAQTIPARVIYLFNNAINFLSSQCRTSVLMCTATQPLLHAVDPKRGCLELSAGAEVIGDVQGLFQDLRRVEVVDARKAGGWTFDEVSERVAEELARSGSVLTIVNTKDTARKLFDLSKTACPNVFHLSTSMCPAHRLAVLDRVRSCLDPRTQQPVVCVSTALIEAGVDVDFGSVIRYLAGLDSIAQAAGRCNRNATRASGRVTIVNAAQENLKQLPEIRWAQSHAERVLDEFIADSASLNNDVIGPASIARYFKYAFFDREKSGLMAYPVKVGAGHEDSLLSLLSTNSLTKLDPKLSTGGPPTQLKQSFRGAADEFRAIDSPTSGIVVPYGAEGRELIAELCSAYEVGTQGKLLRRAQHFSVNVFPHVLNRLAEEQAVHEVQEDCGIFYVDESYYSPEFGLSVESVQPMSFLFS